ncbi:RING-H2 finger ATL48-like [Olea europaea subsp. europaea]|uniref:RING-H2 finger ATL48-like n=1 Tax=Olea europaea subsp. europaea TaxID=158383 RepID=A0A8S0PQL4_OLEEU|nr:RING-H2 finger ATL48-like [Olea europaea subsp. europaea]
MKGGSVVNMSLPIVLTIDDEVKERIDDEVNILLFGQEYCALITAGVLTAGLISFRQGNSHLGQKLMRARVVVQGATVALMVGTAYYYGEKF